jgi:hypothetical protein
MTQREIGRVFHNSSGEILSSRRLARQKERISRDIPRKDGDPLAATGILLLKFRHPR